MKLRNLEKICNTGIILGLALFTAGIFIKPLKPLYKIGVETAVLSSIARAGCYIKKRNMHCNELDANGYIKDYGTWSIFD